MSLHSKVASFIFERLKKVSLIEDVGVTDELVNTILLAKLMDYLGMDHDWGSWGPSYKHQNPNVSRLVMNTPGIRPAITKLLEDIFENGRKKIETRSASWQIDRGKDRRNYESWHETYNREVSRKFDKVVDELINEYAAKLAEEDAMRIFEQGSLKVIEQLTARDVKSGTCPNGMSKSSKLEK